MHLFNTLTRTEEPVAPRDGRVVRMYNCGLTVYARGHIGNFRTFVAMDVLRRALRYVDGYEVRQVTNYTDVDDKTINAAAAAGMPLRDYTDQYIQFFEADAAAMGLEPVEERPRATDASNLEAMAEMIRALQARGHTYQSDGSTYFRIASLPTYGRLARLEHDGIQAGARVDSDNYDKQDARDFVLWKAAKPGEPSWDLGLGPGRPGWHIECSAMALRLLGQPPIDIHGGGIDLIFPHHENEIAQAEGATGEPFVTHWFHVEFLNLDNEKMSKSLGNVFTVRDIVEKGYRASALRYLLMSVHYRKQLTFNWEVLDAAENSLTRLSDFLARVRATSGTDAHPVLADRLARARESFDADIRADLNVPKALGGLFDLVREINAALDAGDVSGADAPGVLALFEHFDRVLGVLTLRRAEDDQPPVPVAEIEQLIDARQEARRARQFARADEIRRDLEARGIVLEDSATGTRWKRK